MAEKLTWEEIEKLYNQEWVELVNFDWPEGDINPLSGVVRVHAKTRKIFDELVAKEPAMDSAFVFAGKPNIPDNVILRTYNSITLKYSDA